MNRDLELQRRLVALEAFSLPTLNLVETLKKILPALHQGMTNFTGMFRPNDPAIPGVGDRVAFMKDADSVLYMDISSMTAYVPEGLGVSYARYLDELKDAVDHAIKVPDLLARHTGYIAKMITNRNFGTSTKENFHEYKVMEQEREKLYANIGRCFHKGSTKAEVRYRDVVARQSEWITLIERMDNLSTQMNRISRKDLDEGVNKCAEYIDSLMKSAELGELDNLSSQAVRELSEGTYQIAAELEFFSVVYFRIMALSVNMQRTQDAVKKIAVGLRS